MILTIASRDSNTAEARLTRIRLTKDSRSTPRKVTPRKVGRWRVPNPHIQASPAPVQPANQPSSHYRLPLGREGQSVRINWNVNFRFSSFSPAASWSCFFPLIIPHHYFCLSFWYYSSSLVLTPWLRTIVKPLWRLPPSEAQKTLRSSTNISQTKNVALKSPKISLKNKGYFGDLRATFLRSLLENYFSMSFWVSWGFWVTGAL